MGLTAREIDLLEWSIEVSPPRARRLVLELLGWASAAREAKAAERENASERQS